MQKNLYVLLLIVSLFATGCKSSFEKLLEQGDAVQQEEAAKKHFENCEYEKASPLFKKLIPIYAGTAKVEKMFYYFAYCDYGLGDYGLAAYEFKRLIQRFPRGVYAERAQYMLGMSYYKEAPPYFLDQEYTVKAISEFQLFLDRYPSSDKSKEVVEKIEELLKRLETKDVQKASLYFKIGDYQSAVVAFADLIEKYPESNQAESFYYTIVEASYKFAEQSIESKKIERFNEVVKHGVAYKKIFGNGAFKQEVEKLMDKASKKAKELKYQLPEYYYTKKNYYEAIQQWEALLKQEKNKELNAKTRVKLLNAQYVQALNGATENKLKNYSAFLSSYNRFEKQLSEKDKDKFKKEVKSAKKNVVRLTEEQGFELVSEGKYSLAVDFFKGYLSSKTVQDGQNSDSYKKQLYYLMRTQWDLSRKSGVEQEYLLLKEIKAENDSLKEVTKNGAYIGKTNKLMAKVDDRLKDFPVILIKKKMSVREYKAAVIRAQQILNEDYSKETKEEVVYLLIAAAVKHAKKLDLFEWTMDFERYERFKLAESLYKKHAESVEKEELKGKLLRYKAAIDKGLIKYYKKEE